jgi:hypothetical protein
MSCNMNVKKFHGEMCADLLIAITLKVGSIIFQDVSHLVPTAFIQALELSGIDEGGNVGLLLSHPTDDKDKRSQAPGKVRHRRFLPSSRRQSFPQAAWHQLLRTDALAESS